MPELPEVETVRRGLETHILRKRIGEIKVLHPRAVRADSELPLSAASGARVTEIRRIGKFLWFVLDREFALVGHLGMSGQLIVKAASAPAHPHLRASFGYGRGREVRFIDQRTFGWLAIDQLVDSSRGRVPRSCAHIAADVFSADFDLKSVIADISRRKSEIKRVLLNQEIVSGIGNIYADEALWYARIHPERLASDLKPDEIRSIIAATRRVMVRALKQGGTSFDELYVNVNGESGYFDIALRAYGCEDEPCHRCGSAIRRIAFANRSSHFCPRCQPRLKSRPRPRQNSR